MNVTQAIKKLQSSSQKVCVVSGTESFLIDSFLHTLTSKIISPEDREFAISKYDMRESSLSTILQDAETAPFLVSTKLIIATHAHIFTATRDSGSGSASGNSKAEKDQAKLDHQIDDFVKYLQSPAPHSIVVFVVQAEKLDDRKKIVKLLKSLDLVFPFFALPAQELRGWIEQRVREENFQMTPEAIDMLIAQTNGNLQMISIEIDKLRTFVGASGSVEAQLVQQFVARSLEQNIFLLIDYVVTKRLDLAMLVLDDLLRQKEEPIKIAMLIVRQFRIILQVKQLSIMGYSESQIASQISVAPYAVKVAQSQARQYEFAQLAEILSHLADLDFHMKTGKIDKVLGLEMFFMKLVNQN